MIEELFQLYHKDVYFYILSLCKNQTLSEDLTSETFYQVMLSLSSFQGQSHIKTWIFSIARHVTYKELSRKKIEISTDTIPDLSYSETYSYQIDEIKECMKKQPEMYQKVFEQRLEGYAFDEIAENLHLNPSSVRVIQHRNIKYLKQKLERKDDYE